MMSAHCAGVSLTGSDPSTAVKLNRISRLSASKRLTLDNFATRGHHRFYGQPRLLDAPLGAFCKRT